MINDFLVLDLINHEFTRIRESGFPRGMRDHTLSPISATELLVVGGGDYKFVSNRVKIFNTEKYEWVEKDPLPAEFGGSEGGLWYHKAVTSQNENGATVFCLGGYIDKSERIHSSHITAFEISF